MRVFVVSLIGLMCSVTAFGMYSRKITATVGAPIPTAYSASNAQSLAMYSLPNLRHGLINNTTSSAIACNVSTNSYTQAPQDNRHVAASEDIFIPATTAYAIDELGPMKVVYCRSDSGSDITSGSVLIHLW